MKELYLYLLENINIFEASTGVVVTDKNIDIIVKYLSEYQNEVKCIIPDSEEVRSKYTELDKWFCNYDDISKALFFLKTNGMLCMYKPNVETISDEELKEMHIKRDGEDYYLPGITTKLQATSKKLNSSNSSEKIVKTDLKIWPDSWDKYIVKGTHKVDKDAKLPTTVIDFKNQGAYIIPKNDFDKLKSDLHTTFIENFGEDSVISKIFGSDDIKKYLSSLDKEGKIEVSKAMANVLSEPLAILYTIYNVDGVQIFIRNSFDEPLGEIDQIIIPIRQNWPVADFYIHFTKMPARLVAVSVKSNGGGNTSTILGCLPVAAIDNISVSNQDAEALKEFLEYSIPQFSKGERISLKIDNNLSNRLKNVAMYALYLLKEQTKDSKIKNANKIINTFKSLIDLLKKVKNKDEELEELYNNMNKVCELGGTNFIEKLLVAMFNTNDVVLSIIKNAVADATSCYKITIYDNGKASVLKQSSDSNSFKLIAKQCGQGLNFEFDKNDKIINITKGHLTKQGQWFGYKF
jgi:hypothetical protein